MDDAFIPETQPAGALVPPTKIPGTALAIATPPPPREPRRVRNSPSRMNAAQFFTNLLLDSVDNLADAVADTLGLRSR